MFKLIADVVTKNSQVVATEQFFTEGERELAIAVAARLDASQGYSNVSLLEIIVAKSLVPVSTGKPGEFQNKRLNAAKFNWIKFKAIAKPAPKKPRKIAATVTEFDLPAPAPKKRLTKRQREFGEKTTQRTLEAVNS
jgi:hypothetical protein